MKLETKTAATKSGRKIICQLNGKTGIVSVDGGIMGRVVVLSPFGLQFTNNDSESITGGRLTLDEMPMFLGAVSGIENWT